MRDFEEIFDAIKSGKAIPDNDYIIINPIPEPSDKLQLSLQGQKRLGAKPVKDKMAPPPCPIKTDKQGNKIRLSDQASKLGQSGAASVAWETRIKDNTNLPEVRADIEKISILVDVGLLQEKDK